MRPLYSFLLPSLLPPDFNMCKMLLEFAVYFSRVRGENEFNPSICVTLLYSDHNYVVVTATNTCNYYFIYKIRRELNKYVLTGNNRVDIAWFTYLSLKSQLYHLGNQYNVIWLLTTKNITAVYLYFSCCAIICK